MTGRLYVSWELIARSGRRTLRTQVDHLQLGLAGPLAICLYTLLRPFELRQGYHLLAQTAVLLAGWYTVFPLLHALIQWSKRQPRAEADDTRHLPLSQLHFFYMRALEQCAVPLLAAALTLPLWLAVLLYIGIPYGEQWAQPGWHFMLGRELTTLWPWRMLWVTLALIAATLLSTAYALWLAETVSQWIVRWVLLLGLPAGVFMVERLLHDSHIRLNYRQTSGYDLASFLLPVLLWLALIFGTALLRPGWRFALCALALVLACGGFWVEDSYDSPQPRTRNVVLLHSARMALPYLAGHLSPPQNVRWLLGSLNSNVLLSGGPAPVEPEYPDYSMTEQLSPEEYENVFAAYYEASDAYSAAYAKLPRLPMWVGAGLYPLLVALLAAGGLTLGYWLRRAPPRL